MLGKCEHAGLNGKFSSLHYVNIEPYTDSIICTVVKNVDTVKNGPIRINGNQGVFS